MACYDCEESSGSGTTRLVMTVLMTGIVALATWDLWGRHMAPFVYGYELSVADIVQALLGIQNKLMAEAIYFATAIPFVSLMYLYVWRPLFSEAVIDKHWFLSGTSYGVALFAIAEGLMTVIMTIPSHATLFSVDASGWLIGALATGIATAGFIRLREMGRQII